MKIQELQVDRFGVWRGLNLPLTGSNITVFYGPNEAGKSTLMRFIRGILYGFQPRDERGPGPQAQRLSCRGVLRLQHHGREFEISRESSSGTRGRVRIDGDEDAARNESQLTKILGGAGEALFENVFAIGLQEMQELATLDGAEVARHIYGISLGLEGERVLQTQLAVDQDRARLIGDDRLSGVIVDLAKQLDGFDNQIVKTGDQSQRHADLLNQRERLEGDVGRMRRRQHDVQQNLRGWQFLEKVWGPWNRDRQLRADIAAMPSLAGVTESALDELDSLERELDGQETRRRKLIDEARRLFEQADSLQLEPQLEEHVCTIRKLVEQQDQVRQLERTLPDRKTRVETLRKECEGITPGGVQSLTQSADRFQLGSSTTHILLDRARRYRSAVSRRSRLVKRYKKATAALAKRQALFDEQVRQLGGMSVDQMKLHTTRRLEELEQLMRLETRKGALQEAYEAATDQINNIIRPRELPPYFYLCLWFFGVAGVVLFLGGLYGAIFGLMREGVRHTAWIIGACYAFLGACAGGVTWTMKEHFEPRQVDVGSLKYRHRELEVELASVTRQIEKILQTESVRAGISLPAVASIDDEITETEVMAALRRRLVDLESLTNREDQIEGLRRRLSRWRQAVQHFQKDVSNARREWCELLRKLGLSETIKISEAFQSWEKIAESRSLWNDWQQSQRDYERDRLQIEAFRKLAEELSKHLSPDRRGSDVYALIGEWDRRLRILEERRRERSQLRVSGKQKKREAEQFDGPVAELRARRESLLNRCQCSSRDDLASRIKLLKRSGELHHLLSMAQRELETVARTEPELALVEEDLQGYEQNRNKRLIETSTVELAELDQTLQQSYETLGRVKAELRELENDRRGSSLRYDRAQVQADLQSAIEQWCVGEAAKRSLERVRQRLEAEGQSSGLKLASEYLEKLTCGKYRRIWAPIGEKHLVVDEDQGQSFRVEHLSSGTREQVFLSVRLAMAKEFNERGASLPLVLDDVTVNFDQVRTEAAVKTLVDVAESGQQVLMFTCHQHLAHLFQQQGIEPIWLPANAASEFRYAS